MLAIRFARTGKKNHAQFKIVLQENTVAPGGRHVEILGSYDPHLKSAVLKEERIKYWISKGAKASDTVYNLLVSKGVLSGEKRKVKLPAKKVEEVKTETAAETPKTEEVKTEEVPVVEKKTDSTPSTSPEQASSPQKEEVKTEEVKAE